MSPAYAHVCCVAVCLHICVHLLQVRPEEEVRIARVSGAVNVPLFRVDKSVEPGSLIKQMSAFGMGGWWLGTKHMVANTQVRKADV